MPSISPLLLESLGVTLPEAQVYLACLELGQANVQQLSKKSGVKRTSIYHFLPFLIRRGFLQETKKRKRVIYTATAPEHLLEILRARTVELEKALPELNAIHNASKTKPKVTYFEGLEGIEEVYADMLKEKKPIIAYEDLEHMKAGMRSSFYASWPSERAKRNISFKSITRDSEVARTFLKQNVKLLRQSKLLQVEDLKTEINMYGDKVALMSFQTDPPYCVLIEDKNVATTLRVMWEELWKRLGQAVG